MTMWWRRNTLLAVVLLFVLTGCSSGDDTSAGPDDTTQSGAENTGGEDTGGEDTGGDGSDSSGEDATTATRSEGAPAGAGEDFPVDIPEGWTIDILAEIGLTGSGGVQLLYPNDQYDTLVAFYDQWTTNQPDEYARTEAGDMTIFTRLESPAYSITITHNHQERDDQFTYLLVVADSTE